MSDHPVNFKITAQDAATQIFKSVEASLHNLESTYKSIGKTGQLVAGAFGLHEIIEGVDKVIDKGVEWETANNRIIGQLKATGLSAGVTKREIEEMAETLSKSSLADDDAIKGVSATLLKFGNIQEDVFKRAVRDSLDLAGVMNNDFSGAAQKLGQALANPLEGLKGLQQEIGKLNPAEKEAIENLVRSGDLRAAQARVLALVESRVGGLAQQLNNGLTKSTKDAEKAWDDLLKAIARTEQFKSPVQGFFDTLTHGLEKTKELVEQGWFDKLSKLAPFTNPVSGSIEIGKRFRGKLFGSTPLDPSTDTVGDKDDAEAGQDQQSLAARTAAAKRLEEERHALLLAAAQKTASAELAAVRSRAAGLVDAEKNLGEARLKVLDLYNDQGLVSIRDFYNNRRSIEEAATQAEIAGIDQSVAAQRNLLGFLKEPEQQIAAKAAIDAELRKRQQLVNNLGTSAVTSTLQQQRAEESLRDTIIQVNNDIARQEGRLAAAAAGDETLQTRTLRRQVAQPANRDALAALGIDDPQAALDKRRDLLILNGQFQEQQARGAAILDTISAKEASIEAQRKQGAITDTEALRRTGEAHAEQLDRLRQIGEAMSNVAQQMANPQLIAQAEQFKARIDDLAASVDLLGQRARTTFEEGLTGFLDAAIGRTKSLKDAFRDLVSDVGRQLLHLSNQQVAQTIFGKNGAGGGAASLFGSGGFGAILKTIFGGGSDPGAGAELGFAGGGDFIVGGSGGTDSQRVSFKATPGEHVSIRTPSQQRTASNLTTVDASTHLTVQGNVDSNVLPAVVSVLADQQRVIKKILANDAYRRGGSARQLLRG